jgi:hypothetical protein
MLGLTVGIDEEYVEGNDEGREDAGDVGVKVGGILGDLVWPKIVGLFVTSPSFGPFSYFNAMINF